MGGVAPASSARDFESLDFLRLTQVNSSNQRSVMFVESLLGGESFPCEVSFNPPLCGWETQGSERLGDQLVSRAKEPGALDSAQPPGPPRAQPCPPGPQQGGTQGGRE